MQFSTSRSLLALGALAQLAVAAVSVNNNLPTNWTSNGCYTEGDGTRALTGASYQNTTGMTEKSCITFCDSKNFIYAGIEYGQECYCGQTFKGQAAKVALTDCNMGCTGNKSEACGAGNRLNTFWSGAKEPDPPVVNPGVTGYNSMGCYSDNVNGRALVNGVQTKGGSSNMTIALCVSACKASNYAYAGVEYGGECFCGSAVANGGKSVTDGCSMLCNGNQTEYCGGSNRLNVYKLGAPAVSASVAASSSTSAKASSSSSAVSSATKATSASSKSSASSSAVSSKSSVSASSTSAAASSDNPGRVVTKATSAASSSAASSSSSSTRTASSSAASSSSTPTSAASSSVASSSSTSTSAAATGLPTGWNYRGCYVDNKNGRILANQQTPDDPKTTIESCVKLCNKGGYKVAGIEYGTQCFCGNQIIQGGEKGNEADCSVNCGGDATEKCGGGNRMSIYAVGTLSAIGVPTPQNSSLPGSFEYAGCYTEGTGGGPRALPYQFIDSKNNSATACCEKCYKFGYMTCGLEYGEECYCGDDADMARVGSKKAPESECSTACPGNSSYLCGGGNRLTLYRWGGDPLYEWNYPQGNDAGEYRNFIGGVVIPLVTVPGINGKITFVEKYGTSTSGNSTGAYELDPSLADDFSSAWREMHGLKTDVFCSAGLVLPDKGGRSINIGGWSGDSTYGLRFYTPDGSPGKASKNQWEENYQEIHLQAGRWYPSAMQMVNGSILVVGGEDGSNGKPVPSLEILPKSGGTIYCDWLARTDPNNLYPYLAVLPSGGIFVAYYNEARILDAATFNTIKTLPMIPGAVNKPESGRTYPFEGTSMLMPQHAPYSDPLEILICGGSNPGAAIALDNCVTIAPDAAEPKWTLERMPSKRVMSCITALPDGTYLILNGAHQGVAGFGLATDPNLNAVLYDPTLPVGKRMSVMANTTVARMYHSEAVLMDDGRVLVTGSDPEDGKNPQEYRVEVFLPPYIKNGKARPSYTISNKDWSYGQSVTIGVTIPSGNAGGVQVSLMGAVASTHGNSMGQRTLFPAVSCAGTSCTITAPPKAEIATPGWYQLFVLDGGVPSTAQWVRLGGDPAKLGSWPDFDDFTKPGS